MLLGLTGLLSTFAVFLCCELVRGAVSHDAPIPPSLLADHNGVGLNDTTPRVIYEPLNFHVGEHNIRALVGHVLVCSTHYHAKHHVLLKCNESIVDVEFVPEGEFLDEPWSLPFIIDLTICVVCIFVAAIASGLTVGMMGMSKVEVGILARAGTEKEKLRAARVLPLIERHHLLLCTLLLINATAMEALPIFLDHMVPPAVAIVLSVTAVLIFGEIIPQALCTRFGLAIGAALSPLIWVWMCITVPISYPIAKLLDFLIGEEHHLYRRGELKELIALHGDDLHDLGGHGDNHSEGGRGTRVNSGEIGLGGREIQILQSVLDMRTKTVVRRMTQLEDVFMLALDAKLDEETIAEIVDRGHSRVPVHLPHDRNNVVGMLLTKTLIGLSTSGPDPPIVSSLELRPMPVVSDTKPLLDLLKVFQGGRSHMALVLSSDDCVTLRGIVTLEDLIEELLQTEILDETDVLRKASPASDPLLPPEVQNLIGVTSPNLQVQEPASRRRASSLPNSPQDGSSHLSASSPMSATQAPPAPFPTAASPGPSGQSKGFRLGPLGP